MACVNPRRITLPDGRSQVVRCEKCLDCLSHRQAGWISRLHYEMKDSPDGCYFLTLTYDDDHVPLKEVSPGEFLPCISSADIKKFHMDIRKRFQQGFYNDDTLLRAGWSDTVSRISLPECHFKYYVTSEYGPNGTRRPHYHGFYSHLPTDEDLVFDLFNKIWGKGFITMEKAKSEACAAYVSKYLVNDSLVPYDRRVDKPRAWISKGLGSSYLDNPNMLDWHRSAPLAHQYVAIQGRRAVMPRYWRDKIFDDEMKAVVLDECVSREDARNRAFGRLSPAAQLDELDRRRHDYEENVRQAEWRFRKNGKIK